MAKKKTGRPKFPLTLHASGNWCKRIGGRLYYFGRDKEEALRRLASEGDDIRAGRRKGVAKLVKRVTLEDLCDAFLSHKAEKVTQGDVRPRTWADYRDACRMLLDAVGKERDPKTLDSVDFAAVRDRIARGVHGKRIGSYAINNRIIRVRSIFNYAFEERIIPAPPHYGASFDLVAKKIVRAARQKAGARMFEAEEIRLLLEAADPTLRAMILLGINCGFGNADCGLLPIGAVNLKTGWVNFPRPKTANDRRAKLWPETIAALQAAEAKRPKAKLEKDADCFFITKYGGAWHHIDKECCTSPICQQFGKLLRKTNLYRCSRGFYSLRRSFATIASDSLDQITVDFIMGHCDESMSRRYRQRNSDSRIEKVCNYVRAWLFDKATS